MPEIEIRRCWLQTAYKDTLEDRVEVAEVTVGCVIVGGVSGSLISHHIITPLFYTHTLKDTGSWNNILHAAMYNYPDLDLV